MEALATLLVIAIAVIAYRQHQKKRDEELINLFVAAIAASRQNESARGRQAETDRLLGIEEAVQARQNSSIVWRPSLTG
ncbi:hypothetical protein [Lysobacter sp. GCM10012299]|uniref:hypothetical protein n=1 Tax=Lysobacter sp. GCM10012299 TaxID=3317333 RepID=UPI003611F15E